MSGDAVKAAGRGMSVDELRALPVAVDLPTAGRAWGIGRNKIHELARAGQAPFPVLRLGNSYRVTRADLLRSLGITPDMEAAGPAQDRPAPNTTPPTEGRDDRTLRAASDSPRPVRAVG